MGLNVCIALSAFGNLIAVIFTSSKGGEVLNVVGYVGLMTMGSQTGHRHPENLAVLQILPGGYQYSQRCPCFTLGPIHHSDPHMPGECGWIHLRRWFIHVRTLHSRR